MPPSQVLRFGTSYSSFNAPIMRIDLDTGLASTTGKGKTELTT